MGQSKQETLTLHEQQTVADFFGAIQQVRQELSTGNKIVWTIADFQTDKLVDDQLIFTKIASVHHPYTITEQGFTITDLDLSTPDNQQIMIQLILRGKTENDFRAIVKGLSIKHDQAAPELQKSMFKGFINMVKYIGEGVHQINWG